MKHVVVHSDGTVEEKILTAEEEAQWIADRESDVAQIEADNDAYFESKTYDKKRASKYPSIGDQLDMIFHAGLGGDEFQAAIQAVKDAYPKPSE